MGVLAVIKDELTLEREDTEEGDVLSNDSSDSEKTKLLGVGASELRCKEGGGGRTGDSS